MGDNLEYWGNEIIYIYAENTGLNIEGPGFWFQIHHQPIEWP